MQQSTFWHILVKEATYQEIEMADQYYLCSSVLALYSSIINNIEAQQDFTSSNQRWLYEDQFIKFVIRHYLNVFENMESSNKADPKIQTPKDTKQKEKV